jgi:hypothetical protein
VLAGAVVRLGEPLSRAGLHALLGDADLYPVLDRARPGQADEHLGLFHQTLADHLLSGIDRVAPHRALADTVEELAPASKHDPKGYRSNPLFRYAFDAGPRHRWEAGQPELLVANLAQRTDPVPRVNLARWITWSDSIRGRLGLRHPGTLTTRHNIALWTGRAREPTEALRLFRELLPDSERVLGPDDRETLLTRVQIAYLTGVAGEPAEALRLARELLPDSERVLGPDDPLTLRVRHHIAYLTGVAGEPAEALRLFRELLPDRERVLGRDHPDTVTTRTSIAALQRQTGDEG